MYTLPSEQKVLENIDKYISEFEHVIIFDTRDQGIKKLVDLLFSSEILKYGSKRILIIGVDNFYIDNSSYMAITENEYRIIQNYFNMYEFSDRLCIVSPTSQYGSMLNYLYTGLITEEEYLEALLY